MSSYDRRLILRSIRFGDRFRDPSSEVWWPPSVEQMYTRAMVPNCDVEVLGVATGYEADDVRRAFPRVTLYPHVFPVT